MKSGLMRTVQSRSNKIDGKNVRLYDPENPSDKPNIVHDNVLYSFGLLALKANGLSI